MTKHVRTHGPTHGQHVHMTPMAPNDAPPQGATKFPLTEINFLIISFLFLFHIYAH